MLIHYIIDTVSARVTQMDFLLQWWLLHNEDYNSHDSSTFNNLYQTGFTVEQNDVNVKTS